MVAAMAPTISAGGGGNIGSGRLTVLDRGKPSVSGCSELRICSSGSLSHTASDIL